MFGTPTLNRLLSGNPVEFEGIKVFPVKNSEGKVTTGESLNPGDVYIAERNGPPLLLTAQRIDFSAGIVLPDCKQYPFNFDECVKVRF
ncbi:MAG: hypothetical protein V4690_04255 [Patescibacteria group bacterium]